MKKNLLLILQIVWAPILLSQTYTPFPVSNATWIDYDLTCDPSTHGAVYYFNTYQLAADTIINSYTYSKLLHLYSENFMACNECPIFFAPVDLFGYILNDTSARNIYFLHKDSTTESLLYSFSL